VNRISVIPLPHAPSSGLVFQSQRPGAALLEGWSDDGAWRILLPWPEETRTLGWDEAADWQSWLPTCDPAQSSFDAPFDAPFLGGWVGYLSYEATAFGEAALPRTTLPPEPAAFFALHRSGVLVNPWGHTFVFHPEGEPPSLDVLSATPSLFQPHSSVVDSFDGTYAAAVERIRTAIADGDVYQVNLTRSFTLRERCDPAALYLALTGTQREPLRGAGFQPVVEQASSRQPPRCSAFLRGDGWTIASASPEVLLRFDRHTGIAESRPIKGTVRRTAEDAIDTLLASEKDASEHLMIVDVVRNDFGKLAPPGAVSVPRFRDVQTLEHVHHLESTVRAEGLHDASVADVLAALSPAASITGAPKRAAVRMIRELEPGARGVYCGSIGYIDARGHAELSVAIRTAVATAAEVRYHAGGGIVWDSDAAAEDDETRAKSAAFFRFAGVEP
jgi:para-aminobenzoate synthetase component 1